ncbi:MAG: MlaD family protein [Gemmatimonadales bacterium]
MDLYYKQEVKVGLLVIVAIAGFFGGLTWLTGRSLGAKHVELMARFENIGTLTVGDPVQISGVNIGRVAHAELEAQGQVLVRIEVEERFAPKIDASATIKSLDFLGAKFVDYKPGTSSIALGEDQVITGLAGSDLAETTAKLTDNAVQVLTGMERMLSEQMSQDLHNTLVATQRALDAMASVGEGPLVSNLQQTLLAFQNVAVRLDSTLANPGINKSLSQLDELTESVQGMTDGIAGATTALGDLLRSMADTSGSLGKILSDSTLHGDVHELLVSMTKLLDDIRERPGRYTFVSVF